MKAMRLHSLMGLGKAGAEEGPLRLEEVACPQPGPGEVLLQVQACGVCHTELDEIEGRTPPPRLPVIPGHEVIGRVVSLGPGCSRHQPGDRVGVGWIHCGCGGEQENIQPGFLATGRDVDGGYAEYMTVPEGYAVPVPATLSALEAAPLLCAGAVGYRALRLTGLRNGERLGLTGFGGSAHLVLAMARHLYPDSPIQVYARGEGSRQFAREQGADWVGETTAVPPEPPAAIIDTTPAWLPVLSALEVLRPGGRLVINAIRKEDTDHRELGRLSYHRHLWLEKEIKSVANVTVADIAGMLELAGTIALKPVTESYRLEEANRALRELRSGGVRGAKVLVISEEESFP